MPDRGDWRLMSGLVEPLLGSLSDREGTHFGYRLEAVRGGEAIELVFRGAHRELSVWLRDAAAPGGSYRRTSRFRIGYHGPAPDPSGMALLDALCDEVRRNEDRLFADGHEPPLPWQNRHSPFVDLPPEIEARRRQASVLCTQPWTTLEIVDPDGKVRQCCATWTEGHRGSFFEASLAEIWNGPGYRAARRMMGRGAPEGLCRSICPRLHDGKLGERELRVWKGSAPFVANQMLLVEDVAQRREEVRCRPIHVAICPSTYCNYDCIMCECGRTPRRDLPDRIWAELTELLPTLHILTLLGGEPLANPAAMRFLRDFDGSRFPDAVVDVITNGSLLNRQVLKHLERCNFGDVTVSLNAGTPEVYAAVQRGCPFSEVLKNLDALLEFRDRHPRKFQVTLSFVVQPANAHTLIPFAEIALARKLRIRLLPLNPLPNGDLDYYGDPDAVARVLGHVDDLLAFASRSQPAWIREIRGTRAAIQAEAERARRRRSHPSLPLLGASSGELR